MLVDRARTKCMNRLKKLCLKFRKNVCKGLHFVRDNEVCVYAPGNSRLGKNMLDLLCNMNSEGAKLEQRCIYLIILILSLSPTAARTLGNTSWPASLASLESGPESLL